MLGSGGIQQDGTFVIDAYQPNAFLERGRYDIVLRPVRSLWNGKNRGFADQEESEPAKDKQAETKPNSEIPERFLDVKTSGLWVNLEKDSNWVEINLRDQKD